MDQTKIKKTDPDNCYRRVLAAGTLMGDKVRNFPGEDLGKVAEIMIDIPSGKVVCAVVSFGGVLGVGNKLFAVPWSLLSVDEDQKCFTLDLARGRLESAPGFDQNNWPDMTDATWRSKMFQYYGVQAYLEDEKEKAQRSGGGA